MSRLKLAVSLVILLGIAVGLSSYFALTALSNLYVQVLAASAGMPELNTAMIQPAVESFVYQQITIALVILSGAGLMLLLLIVKRVPPMPEQWSLKTIAWPLFYVSSAAQLLALALHFAQFAAIAPTHQISSSDLLDVFIEVITSLVIATLLCVELLILLLRTFQAKSPDHQSPLGYIGSIRPTMFLFIVGVDLSSAFVPLYMERLYQPLLDLPQDVVLGLPISAMFLCVSIAIVVSGIWIDRRGWHQPLLFGMALTAAGKLYAWMAPSAVHFIIAMGMVGIGYGLALMASQGFVIGNTDDKSKARGLAYLFAGFYAADICGRATGAMLAERVGYSTVFLLGAVLVLLALAFALSTLRGAIVHAEPQQNKADSIEDAPNQQAALPTIARRYWNFLSNRQVLGLIFLSSLPSAVLIIGFLNYFSPVYLHRMGVSDSIIGSVLMIYGLCMVYLAPIIATYIDARDDKRLFIILGCVLSSCALFSFQLFTGLVATIITVFMLGVSSCFILPSQTTYALTLNVTKQLGQGRAIGLFRASARIGQMLGPIVFSSVIVAVDITQGITYVGVASLIGAVLFALVVYPRRTSRNKEIFSESSPASS